MDIPSSATASGLAWVDRAADARAAIAIAQQHDVPELLANILAGRGIAVDDVPQFLAPTLRDQLPDPFHLKDMDKAISRIVRAIEHKETIAIFGDYDVDGATSTALLWHFLTPLGVRVLPYIPDRAKEGYGPTIAAFDTLLADGAQLIVTVDCGTMAHAPINHANAKGVDVVVFDHHLSSSDLPAAHALVNPNRYDETSDQRHLAAVGVTFLVLVALNKTLREKGFANADLLGLLDMVALGTVCDVMPLTGLNRAFVSQGLKRLGQRRQRGLAALADVANLNESPSAYHLGFIYGPRINAGGRVGEAGLGVRLLTSDDDGELQDTARRLHKHNAERQAIEADVLEKALAQAQSQANAPVIVVAGEGWHQGVIGIVAGRLKEKYARPAAVISLDGAVGKGSARSVSGANMGAAIHAAVQLGLLTHGGGHAMAAGFSLKAEKLDAFRDYLCERMARAVTEYAESRVRKLDGWISTSSANAQTVGADRACRTLWPWQPQPAFWHPSRPHPPSQRDER